MRENLIRRVFTILCLVIRLTLLSVNLQGQSLPEVPSDINLAGVPIHLTQQGRLQVHQEMQLLYASPGAIYNDISALHQLIPILKPLLDKAKLPDDFRFVIQPFANVDSLGFWALSQRQAQRLNLRIDNDIDERFHLTISTEAVINHLEHLQEIQKNYALTLIRYLQENISLRASQSIDPSYILLDLQSPPLIWKVLARKLVFEQAELTYRPAVNFILYMYQNGEGQMLSTVAKRLQVDEERLIPFNKWLKTTYIPTDKEYAVFVQVKPDEFSRVQALATSSSELQDQSLHQPADAFPILVKINSRPDRLRSAAVFYEINERRGVQAQSCDNVITLAFYGDITVSNFLKFNELSLEHDIIRPGEIYYLQSKAKRARIPFHVVQKNQTLQTISAMYGVRLRSLLKYNHMAAGQRLQPGRIIWLQTKRPDNQPVEYVQLPSEEAIIVVPEPVRSDKDTVRNQPVENKELSRQLLSADSLKISEDSLSSNLTTMNDDTLILLDTTPVERIGKIKQHVVIPGQTYYAISRLYGVTVNQLYQWNNLSERIPLRIGQKLIVGNAGEKQRIVVSKPLYKRKTSGVNRSALPKRNVIFYTVHAGQTLYRIATQNKVLLNDLMRWNNLTNNMIEVGQILVIWK